MTAIILNIIAFTIISLAIWFVVHEVKKTATYKLIKEILKDK